MITRTSVAEASSKMGEHNDCSVRAIALATGTKYEIVHELFRQQGRRRRCGTRHPQQTAVLRALGFEYKCVYSKQDRNQKNKFKAKTVTTLERELPSRGIFIAYVRGHMFCARGGKVLDWSAGRQHRLLEIFRVVKSKNPQTPLQQEVALIKPKQVRKRRFTPRRIAKPVLTPLTYTEYEMMKEQWYEDKFERKCNGIPAMSWKAFRQNETNRRRVRNSTDQTRRY